MAKWAAPFAAVATLVSAVIIFPTATEGKGSGLYVFGDSTADVGTNNFIQSIARVNYMPYGIDFPGIVATGRSSNGYNIIDEIAIQLGFDQSPPPFLTLVHNNVTTVPMLSGINFASGGAGIFENASIQINAITMTSQLQQFAAVRDTLSRLLGSGRAADEFLCKSVFLFSIGSNDLLQVYQPGMDKAVFLQGLTSRFREQLTKLYSLGARKFAIVGLPLVGCIPIKLALNQGECSQDLNVLSQGFNLAVKTILKNMSSSLPGFKYSFGDSFALVSSIVGHAEKFGFTETRAPCCRFNRYGLCDAAGPVCGNRSKYLFWDGYHPTQLACALWASALCNTDYAWPVNFKQLITA